MVVVIVNNDWKGLWSMTELVTASFPGSIIYAYTDPMLVPKCVLNHEVDAVLAEVQMHRVDGITLLRILQANRKKLPVFLFADTAEYREEAMQQGASAYLLSPFTQEDLHKALSAAVDGELREENRAVRGMKTELR